MAKKLAVAPVADDPLDVSVFSALVACLEGGQFDNDLSTALAGLVARMKREHRGGGGKPTGKITVTIAFRWEDGTIQTTQNYAVDPSVTRNPDRFFVTPDGGLTQRAPQEAIAFTGDGR